VVRETLPELDGAAVCWASRPDALRSRTEMANFFTQSSTVVLGASPDLKGVFSCLKCRLKALSFKTYWYSREV